MYKQLIINVSDHETRVAHVEDGTISELYVDRGDDSDVTGNIYKGRVLRVLPGMQAAFVDIGLNQAAFIYVDDVYTNDFKEYERMFEINPEEADSETESDPARPPFKNKGNFLIEELLLEGQQLLAQVTKSPIGTRFVSSRANSGVYFAQSGNDSEKCHFKWVLHGTMVRRRLC